LFTHAAVARLDGKIDKLTKGLNAGVPAVGLSSVGDWRLGKVVGIFSRGNN